MKSEFMKLREFVTAEYADKVHVAVKNMLDELEYKDSATRAELHADVTRQILLSTM